MTNTNQTTALGNQLVSPGGNYIPFDEANFVFSSAPGLTQSDQEAQIKALNLVILNGERPQPPPNPGPVLQPLNPDDMLPALLQSQ